MSEPKSRLTRDVVLSVLLLLFCGFLIWAGHQIRDPQFGELPPGTWPQVVSYVLTGFCLIYFFQAITGRSFEDEMTEGAPPEETRGGPHKWILAYRNPIVCFAIYFAFLYTLPFFGTLIGGILVVFLLLTALGGFTPRALLLHAVIAAVSVGAMWALFTFGLRVLLPRGELFKVITLPLGIG